MNYISAELNSGSPSAKRNTSGNSRKGKNGQNSATQIAVEEYNNQALNEKGSHSALSSYDSRPRNYIERILNNKKAVIEILNQNSNEDKCRGLLLRLFDPAGEESQKMVYEGERAVKAKSVVHAGNHAKSMGGGEESNDSLLCDETEAFHKVDHKEKLHNHSGVNKRPSSHSNVLRSKSSRQKRRKKTPVHNNNRAQSSLNNGVNGQSKLTQDPPDSEVIKSKKLIDDSKFGNKKSVVNAGMRPKSSRGNRSFESNGHHKTSGKTEHNLKHKRHSMAGVSKTSSNFGKKKHSYGGAGQFNADKLLAKYRQARNTGGVSSSFSTSNIEPQANGLVASIREKNSRNIEKFGENGMFGSNGKFEVRESNSQYVINTDSSKGEIPQTNQNMSFEVNQRQRILKPKKKKDDAAKALLTFEDMKRKVLKDYVKKSKSELNGHVSHPTHHRNGGNIISNYLSQLEEGTKNKDGTEKYMTKEEELRYLTEGLTGHHKKK